VVTLAVLKARIASELDRTDLTTQIAYAISDAVDLYKSRRFRFNQVRSTFSTTAATAFYTTATIPTDIGQVDSLVVTVSGRQVALDPWTYSDMDHIASTTSTQGQPAAWAWYAEQIRLYPTPDAAYTVTISYLQKIDIPSVDTDSNSWTTEALSLIRHSAKRMIASDVLRDDATAAACAQSEGLEYRRLVRDLVQLDVGPIAGSM
jgi:hypothetical protein